MELKERALCVMPLLFSPYEIIYKVLFHDALCTTNIEQLYSTMQYKVYG